MPKTVKFNHIPIADSLVLIAYRAVMDERCGRMTIAQSEGLNPEQQALIIHLNESAGEGCQWVQLIIRTMADRLFYGCAETFGDLRQSKLQPFETLDDAIEYAAGWFEPIWNEYHSEE